MNTTMNTGAASLSECDFVAVPRAAVEWLKEHYPALTEKAGMCERIGKRLYTKTSITTPTPQADAAPTFEAWATKEGLISESHGVRFVNSMCDVARKAWGAAIAAGGAQEAVTDTKSKLPEFSGCIEWSNYRNRQGYGSFKADGKMSLAHRVMYCDYHGVTRDSIKHLVVRHACDNPSCFNPAHLLLGTHADNTKDKIERGRHARGEMNGQSKLSRHQAGQIRSLYVRGSREFGIPALAKKFGVGQSTIREVVLNLRWVETTPSNGEHGS
jgi:hypothetical protein